MIEKTDVVIIGAGPVGLFAIFELGLLNISCHVIDNLDKPGGQCAELYPEKPIYDIPSRVSISGQELTDDLLAQAKPFKPVYHLSQQVEKIEKLESGEWLIMTSVNKSIKAKCIVIAAGAGSFVPRKLPISDIAHLEEKNILYAVRNKSILEGKKLLIVGGGDSALDWTNELSKTSNVTLMHRRKEFKASPDSVSKMLELEKDKKVNFLLGQIKGIEDLKNDKIKVITKNNEETENFEVDYLLPFFGLKMELGPIANWGLNLDENLIKVDTEKFETSVPSIFAIGDINTYPGKLKLILSGFHEAALMAQECFKYCYPDKKNIFRYTTSSKELQKKLTSI
jgi:thioredoxin reductase (NADPH)